MKAQPAQGPNELPHGNTNNINIQQTPQQKDKFNAELDDIARRLESVSHKLGRPVSSALPVPLESNDQETDFLSIQPVRSSSLSGSNESILARLPLSVQELCVMEDLLFLVLNLDGKYFSFHHSQSNMKHVIFVDESVDASILTRLKPVLKAAYCASRLDEFIVNQSHLSSSSMMQALAAALDAPLKEFYSVIMALEKKFKAREIGLHQFCFHLAPFTRTLQSLLHLTFAVESGDVRGGALLKLLEEKIAMVSGDRQLKSTYSSLLEGCAKPFLEELQLWLSTGTLGRQSGNFMISDAGRVGGDDLLEAIEGKFTINPASCPALLADLAERVLAVGVYRNIQGNLLQKANNSIPSLHLRWDRKVLQDAINAAYQDVNVTLMNSLFQSSKLFDAMCAAKRFFFLEQSDFINNFLSTATGELYRPARDTSAHQLQISLDLALKNSALAGDAFASAFTCELSSVPLYDGLVKIIQERQGQKTENTNNSAAHKSPKAVELFNLTMKVQFPESLIMNNKAIAKYQLLFRHIFTLLELIRGLSVPLARIPGARRDQIRQFEVMKAGMLHFVRTVHYYVTFGVLEPHWERFSRALKERRFTSVDEINSTHTDFLDTCLRECMLTNSKIVQLLGMSWSTCFKFAALVSDLNARVSATRLAVANEATFAEVMIKFTALHGHFHKYVKVLIEALQYYAARDCDHYIANFLSSLDCQYYG